MYENKIAYLVPAYNHEKFILNSLNSILNDIKSIEFEIDKEVIIIDDGSTDNSKKIINKWYEENRNCVNINFKSRQNKGLTFTLNELISSTNAEYLRLCSSDDNIIVGSSNILLNNIKSKSSLLAVCGDAIIINDDDKILFDSSIKYHKGNIDKLINYETCYNSLILNWCIAGPVSLIKKEFYEDIKYSENELIDDFFLYLSLIEKDALKVIENKLCFYRIHDTNTSKTIDINKRIKNLNSFLKIIKSFSHLRYKYKSIIIVKYLTAAKIKFLEKKYLSCSLNMLKYFYFRIFN